MREDQNRVKTLKDFLFNFITFVSNLGFVLLLGDILHYCLALEISLENLPCGVRFNNTLQKL